MYIKVKATPGARKESFMKEKKDVFRVSVKEKVERNQANGRIRELVAEYFKVRVGAVRIVNGHHHPSKLLFVAVS